MLFNRRKEASREGTAEKDRAPQIALSERDGKHEAVLTGVWTTRTVAHVDAAVRKIEKDSSVNGLAVDLSKVDRIDTAGAWLIERLMAALRARGTQPTIVGASEAANILLGAVEEASRRDG